MIRKIYADMLSETDRALTAAMRSGHPVEVDGVQGVLLNRCLRSLALGTDRERRPYAVYDVEVQP